MGAEYRITVHRNPYGGWYAYGHGPGIKTYPSGWEYDGKQNYGAGVDASNIEAYTMFRWMAVRKVVKELRKHHRNRIQGKSQSYEKVLRLN